MSSEQQHSTSSDACERCRESSADCECWVCQNCEERYTNDEQPCATCDTCHDCCTCWVCESCQGRQTEDESQCSECDGCESCCDCWTCPHCDRTYRSNGNYNQCSHCDGCEHCCECSCCDGCYERYSSGGCRECDRCDNCCECSQTGDYGIEFFQNPLTFHSATRKQHVQNPSHRYIAVEIEVAAVSRGDGEVSAAVSAWHGQIVEDGSLPHGGFEINTAPASGDRFCDQIDTITDALHDQCATVTQACGLHVHIDARDFTFYDMRRLVLLYEQLEPALFGLVAPSRRTSSYCAPCGRRYADAVRAGRLPKETKQHMLQTVYGVDTTQGSRTGVKARLAQHTGNKYDHARYSALNLHSWFYRGTIECRMHHGTLNAEKIINWGLLWAGILDAAMRLSEAQIAAMSGTSLERLQAVCPTETVRQWVTARHATFNGR